MTATIRSYMPLVLAAEWEVIAEEPEGVALLSTTKGLKVIYSVDREADGQLWLHLSLSRQSRLPSWDDLRYVKDAFLGADRVAYQVLPRAAEYVNLHPFVLHLWSCVDCEPGSDPLPDFRKDLGGRKVI
jgi:hypothetical protein